jgi:hypothetical protein
MTKVDRIISVLRERNGLDDDEISAATDIQPRQTVNQICRRLELQGLLTRTQSGASAKIMNFLKSSTALHRAENAAKPVSEDPRVDAMSRTSRPADAASGSRSSHGLRRKPAIYGIGCSVDC